MRDLILFDAGFNCPNLFFFPDCSISCFNNGLFTLVLMNNFAFNGVFM